MPDKWSVLCVFGDEKAQAPVGDGCGCDGAFGTACFVTVGTIVLQTGRVKVLEPCIFLKLQWLFGI